MSGRIMGLSTQQPWSSLLVTRRKPVENRGFVPGGYVQDAATGVHTCDRPLWLALHAGLRDWKPPPGDLPLGLFLQALTEEVWPGMPAFSEWPRGAFLGIGRVAAVYPADHPDLVAPELERWVSGPWCWRLDHVASFAEHGLPNVPARGKQGLWTLADQELDACRKLARLARGAA